MLIITWRLPAVPRAAVFASLAFPVYYVGLSLALHAGRRAGRA